mmetsp:Transcript_2349/g.9199  ORF Transcript_2349/g.9199 Transcript_2349/m.9199 type:complete len:250 (+) Transcript_2349:558-1307(+)
MSLRAPARSSRATWCRSCLRRCLLMCMCPRSQLAGRWPRSSWRPTCGSPRATPAQCFIATQTTSSTACTRAPRSGRLSIRSKRPGSPKPPKRLAKSGAWRWWTLTGSTQARRRGCSCSTRAESLTAGSLQTPATAFFCPGGTGTRCTHPPGGTSPSRCSTASPTDSMTLTASASRLRPRRSPLQPRLAQAWTPPAPPPSSQGAPRRPRLRPLFLSTAPWARRGCASPPGWSPCPSQRPASSGPTTGKAR